MQGVMRLGWNLVRAADGRALRGVCWGMTETLACPKSRAEGTVVRRQENDECSVLMLKRDGSSRVVFQPH